MNSIRVVYVGPSMAGRRTSIASVLAASGQQANALTLDPTISHAAALDGHSVILRLSVKRSSIFYDNADDPMVDESIRRELQWIVDADAIVFVIDSQEQRKEANERDLLKLRRDLLLRGVDIDTKPIVFQANKRDTRTALPMEVLGKAYRTANSSMVESVAVRDEGTLDALVEAISLMKRQVRGGTGSEVPHRR